MTRPGVPKIAAALLLAALLLGGGAMAVRGSISAAMSGIVSGRRPAVDREPEKPRDGNVAANAATVQIESDSGSRLSLADLEKLNANTFRTRQSYRAGESFGSMWTAR